MFSKIIFVLATVCIVNASVITVNVYNDDPETEVAANPKSCNFQACDQLCRRLKFPGGACVNGRCKCDNFLNAEDEVVEKSFTDLEDLVSLKDDHETEVQANPKSCNFQACDQLCRRLKFPGGACVNGRCKCDNFLNAKDNPETEFATKLSKCHLKLCNLVCRMLNNTRGACVDGRCKCAEKIKAEVSEESLSDPEESVSPRGCNNQGCIEMCRKLNLRGGTCIGGRCVCKRSLQEDAVIDPAEFLSVRDCNFGACDQQCRRLGFPGGACVNGRCKCDNFLNAEDPSLLNDVTSDEQEESNLVVRTDEEELIVPLPRACNTVNCNQMCHRLNYAGGWCRGGACQCY